jgi:4-alpha-glucanotransferase
MSDQDLAALAAAAGLTPHWRDAFGQEHDVTPESLRSVLGALGIPAGNDVEISASAHEMRESKQRLYPLVTAQAGHPIVLQHRPGKFRITFEEGGSIEGYAEDAGGRASLRAVDRHGYHRIEIGDSITTVAVAPSRCYGLAEIAGGRKLWGITAQLYALRRPGDGGIGQFSALRDLVGAAAVHGADAIAISPVHAQFSADPDRFSPYAPSSRVALNVLHADPGTAPPDEADKMLEAEELLDWPAASRAHLRRLRAAYHTAMQNPAVHAELAAFRSAHGEALERHARFEALHGHLFGADIHRWHWRSWPEALRDPNSVAVADFARDQAAEVTFHAYLQYLAHRGVQQAQEAARLSGMRIGLVADLAVGTDSGGSHAWSRQNEMLIGLNIGAPPDLLAREGQDWGITAFSPHGLRRQGYTAFLEMLRASLRHSGGVRIDHVMNLSRLWVLPEGAPSSEGVYLRFPLTDLLRLVALESHRHQALVVGEDLGTLPDGFETQLSEAGILGMRVLWFERDGDRFSVPAKWSPRATAMTSTHDLATVAGWWRGRDIEWRSQLGLLGDQSAAQAERERDRGLLWNAFCSSGSAKGDRPATWDSDPVADAAAVHIGGAACQLALLPIEDALALPEQPNLPGTTHEHPNWRRRLPGLAGRLLDRPGVASRLATINEARRRT